MNKKLTMSSGSWWTQNTVWPGLQESFTKQGSLLKNILMSRDNRNTSGKPSRQVLKVLQFSPFGILFGWGSSQLMTSEESFGTSL